MEPFQRWLNEESDKWIEFATVTGPATAKSLYYSKESMNCVYEGNHNRVYTFKCTNHAGNHPSEVNTGNRDFD